MSHKIETTITSRGRTLRISNSCVVTLTNAQGQARRPTPYEVYAFMKDYYENASSEKKLPWWKRMFK